MTVAGALLYKPVEAGYRAKLFFDAEFFAAGYTIGGKNRTSRRLGTAVWTPAGGDDGGSGISAP